MQCGVRAVIWESTKVSVYVGGVFPRQLSPDVCADLFCEQTMPYDPRTNYKGPAIKRIEAKRTVTDSGCWESPFTPALKYPTISHQGQYVFVHRYMYEYYNGPIPERLFVLHTCDNPRCHNPSHLYLGDHIQNMKDCVERGRHPKKYSYETLSKIFAMRELGWYGNHIAEELGLSGAGVNNVLQQHGMSHTKGGRDHWQRRSA